MKKLRCLAQGFAKPQELEAPDGQGTILENTIGKQLQALNYINVILEDLHQGQKNIPENGISYNIIFFSSHNW